jgi:hypothetical protein
VPTQVNERKPVYSVEKITRLRHRLRDRVLFEFCGLRLGGDVWTRLMATLLKAMPRVSEQTLQDSLQHLVGQTLTPAVLTETAWRFAGNLDRMRRGIPAAPWNGQIGVEWVPCQIVRFAPSERRSGRGDQMASFDLRILAGSPCPCLITKELTYKFCYMLARRLGYTSGRGKRPLADVSELVNLRMLIKLEPGLSFERPGFDKFWCSGSLLKWNKDIIGRRYRELNNKPWPCPRGFRHRCYQCHVGFDQCLAATHPTTLRLTDLQGAQDDRKQATDAADPPAGSSPGAANAVL